MTVNLVCPMCNQTVSVHPDHGQTSIDCPGCGYPILVETSNADEPNPAPSRPEPTSREAAQHRVSHGVYVLYVAGGLAVVFLFFGLGIGWFQTLRMGLLGLAVLMVSTATLFAWKSWKSPSRSEDRYGYGTLATIATICLVGSIFAYNWMSPEDSPSGASASPVPSDEPVSRQAAATLEYWQNLKQINDRFDRPVPNNPYKTMESTRLFLTDLLREAEHARQQLLALPVRDVDSEVTDIGSRFLELYGEAMIFASNFMAVVNETEQFYKDSGSDSAMMEAFVRGYLGDPLGKSNETRAKADRIGAKYDDIWSQMQQWNRRSNELTADANSLRAELTRRHGLEFPSID